MAILALKVVEIIILSLIFLGAFLGNGLLFILVAKVPKLQTKGNVFILNLAAADFMVAIFNLPLTIVAVITEDWVLGDKVCAASGFFTLLTFVASCMALAMISVNRYHAIVHWTTYREKYTRMKCIINVGVVWFITIAISIPPFFGWAEFSFDPGQSYCFAKWSASKSYTIFMIVVCLCGPLTIMSYCYYKIVRYQKNSKKVIVSAAVRNLSRDTSTSVTQETGDDSPSALIKTEPSKTTCSKNGRSTRKLTRTIIILIIVFGLCWSPFALIMLLQVFFNVHVPRYFDFASLILGYLNSFFNVIVYNVTNRNIRDGFKKLFGWKLQQHTLIPQGKE